MTREKNIKWSAQMKAMSCRILSLKKTLTTCREKEIGTRFLFGARGFGEALSLFG